MRSAKESQERNREARKEYMRAYYAANPEKFTRRTPEKQSAYNAARRKKYAENKDWRDAHKETVRQWQADNPEKRHAQRIRKYGLTPATFKALMKSQGWACAICGHTTVSERMFPMVDHCHSTGKVRGILCSNCNMGLGKFKDSQELLTRAIAYLLSRG